MKIRCINTSLYPKSSINFGILEIGGIKTKKVEDAGFVINQGVSREQVQRMINLPKKFVFQFNREGVFHPVQKGDSFWSNPIVDTTAYIKDLEPYLQRAEAVNGQNQIH